MSNEHNNNEDADDDDNEVRDDDNEDDDNIAKQVSNMVKIKNSLRMAWKPPHIINSKFETEFNDEWACEQVWNVNLYIIEFKTLLVKYKQINLDKEL